MGTADQDADEIGQLYDLYGPALLLFASAMAGDRTRAQDAVHHVFLKLIESGSLCKASDQKAFLFACVRNAVLNDTKRRRRDTAFKADTRWFDPPQRDYPAERRLRLALQALPKDQMEVILLHVWGELTFAELGDILSISANDKEFEAYLKTFKPVAPKALPEIKTIRHRPFRALVLAGVLSAGIVILIVGSSVSYTRMVRQEIGRQTPPILPKGHPPLAPLTIRSANNWLATAPSIDAALDDLAFSPKSPPAPANDKSALAALREANTTL